MTTIERFQINRQDAGHYLMGAEPSGQIVDLSGRDPMGELCFSDWLETTAADDLMLCEAQVEELAEMLDEGRVNEWVNIPRPAYSDMRARDLLRFWESPEGLPASIEIGTWREERWTTLTMDEARERLDNGDWQFCEAFYARRKPWKATHHAVTLDRKAAAHETPVMVLGDELWTEDEWCAEELAPGWTMADVQKGVPSPRTGYRPIYMLVELPNREHGKGRSAHVQIRCTPEEREQWKREARRAGLTLSDWMRWRVSH